MQVMLRIFYSQIVFAQHLCDMPGSEASGYCAADSVIPL